MTTNGDPKCKTALITGCGRRRVGFVVAQFLAQRGYNVAIHYHSSAEAAKNNQRDLQAAGVQAETFPADVRNEEDVRSLVAAVLDRFSRIDVLVTTASTWFPIPLEQVSADDVRDSFDVNALGTFLCAKYVGLQMVQQTQGGNIVTIGDSLIAHPYVHHVAYFLAKGSIPTLTRTLAVELGERNPKVRVNCIEPGPVMLPDNMPEAARQATSEATIVAQADLPSTVATTVGYLIDTPMITGSCITLDGGRNVGREQRCRRGTPLQDAPG